MKRREFLVTSASLAGALVPLVGRTQSKPCPPTTVGVAGGGSIATGCGNTAALDWIARSTGPGVVWAHSFDTESEVAAFRNDTRGSQVGIDFSEYIKWNSGDGASGVPGCLECVVPTGGRYLAIASAASANPIRITTATPHGYTSGTVVCFQAMAGGSNSGWGQIDRSWYSENKRWPVTVVNSTTFTIPVNGTSFPAYSATPSGRCQRFEVSLGSWKRPFSPLFAGGNGLSADDPAAAGALVRRRFDPTNPTMLGSWEKGYYSHKSYQGVWTKPASNLNSALTPDAWDGTDFYIQYRVKMPATRFMTMDQPNGKLAFLEYAVGNSTGEIIVRSESHYRVAEPDSSPAWDQSRSYWPAGVTVPFRMYGTKISFANLTDPQPNTGGTHSWQPGSQSPFSSTCNENVTPNSGSNACWWWPSDEWVTVLLHVVPGRGNAAADLFRDSAPYRDFGIEVWVTTDSRIAQQRSKGEAPSYIKIFEKHDFAWSWDGELPAFNAITFNGYMNDVPAVEGWYQRYDQVIFSKQFVPCPSA